MPAKAVWPILVQPVGEQYFHQVETAAGVLGGDGLVLGDDRHDAFLDHRLEQGFLVLVIQIQRALRYAGPARDIFQAGGGKASLDE